MKKLLALLVLLCLCCTMVACGNKNDDANEDPKEELKEEAPKTPCEDALKEFAGEEGSVFYDAWLIYSWTKNNLDAFKNPASVEFTDGDVFYHETASGDIDYFLVEYRADNSFGGKTVSYMKLTQFSLTSTDWQPTLVSPNYYGEKIWRCGSVASVTKDALKEYISLNY
jgi:hypothetical protein